MSPPRNAQRQRTSQRNAYLLPLQMALHGRILADAVDFENVQYHATHIEAIATTSKIDEADITEAFIKGSGPGGQKINKTSCAVQLKHIPTGIVMKCQATRSRTQNRKIARTQLAEKLEYMEKGAESRIAIKINAKAKKKANKRRKAKRKYGSVGGSGGADHQAHGKGEAEEEETGIGDEDIDNNSRQSEAESRDQA